MKESIEELMSDLSSNITVSSYPANNETMVIDMSNVKLPDEPRMISQSPIVENEVKEMIEEQENDFYNNHIKEDLSSLEKEYVLMKRKEQAIDKRIALIKEANSKVFEDIAKLELLKAEVVKDEPKYKEVIARKMFLTGEKKWKGMEVSFTYVAQTFKDKFNMDKFKTSEPNTWAKYVEKSPVSEYIRTKLELLPVREDELKDANENIR